MHTCVYIYIYTYIDIYIYYMCVCVYAHLHIFVCTVHPQARTCRLASKLVSMHVLNVEACHCSELIFYCKVG